MRGADTTSRVVSFSLFATFNQEFSKFRVCVPAPPGVFLRVPGKKTPGGAGTHGCGEAVTVIVLPSLVPAVVVRAPCRKFSTLRVRGTSLLCC